MLTLPFHLFTPYLPPSCSYIRGQMEIGESGYQHWQVVVYMIKACRMTGVKKVFGEECHVEITRSEAANDYVFKDETAVVGTRFELGSKPRNRSESKDWDAIKNEAKNGMLDNIPSDVYIRCYHSLKRIACDHMAPEAIVREVFVYWGPTGTGKSRRAWEEAGMSAFPKDPRTKFWDGYNGHENVVIDEFRGGIDIAHLLRWFDRYPVIVEVKGNSVVLKARKIWITSNLEPYFWYPEVDQATREALMRRLTIINIT